MDSQKIIEKSLSVLSPRERKIFEMRFNEEKTLDEIARKNGLPGKRVRQILARAVEIVDNVSNKFE